VVLAIINII